jgi:hypothetical protein
MRQSHDMAMRQSHDMAMRQSHDMALHYRLHACATTADDFQHDWLHAKV